VIQEDPPCQRAAPVGSEYVGVMNRENALLGNGKECFSLCLPCECTISEFIKDI
jgi:hypothetical protein